MPNNKNSQLLISSYVYPAWHKIAERTQIYGSDWTEWECIKNKNKLFNNHDIESKPLWGYYDDTDEKTINLQIDTAENYGIDIFIYLYYWHNQGVDLEDALLKFLSCCKNRKLKFALMWSPRRPRFRVLRKPDMKIDFESGRNYNLDFEIFKNFIAHTTKNYFHNSSYFKIDNKPVLYLYKFFEFIEKVGKDLFISCIDYANDFLLKQGFSGLYLVGSSEIPDKFQAFSDIKFNAATSYVNLVDFYEGPPLQDYELGLRKKFKLIETVKKLIDVPYFPSIPVGFDASSRTIEPIPLPKDLNGSNYYPYFPISTNRSIEVFKEYLDKGITYVLKSKFEPKIVNIASWNEWSQNHYIEPDERNGYKYLDAIKEIKENKSLDF